MKVDLKKVRSFKTPAAFHTWLEKNHARADVLWLKIYKKSSGVPSVDWESAVVEALAWGWIDSTKMPCDARAYYQRFTPRKHRSSWSKRNTQHVERLIREKRMRPPGLAHVEAAQRDGRWDRAYGSSSEFEIPKDFRAAVRKDRAVRACFEKLTRNMLFGIYYRLQSAKRPETRKKRFDDFLARLKRGEKPL